MTSSKGVVEIPIDSPAAAPPQKSAAKTKRMKGAQNILRTAYRWKKQPERPRKVRDIKTQIIFRIDSPSLKRHFSGVDEFVKRQANARGFDIVDMMK